MKSLKCKTWQHETTGLDAMGRDREYFYQALDWHFPGIKQKYVRISLADLL